MDTSSHTLQSLFCQLGLADEEQQIKAFIERYKPLPSDVSLPEASFWNEAQAVFLNEAKAEDSDWCELVDTLDCLLRTTQA
ncbi:MAG: DUF2789 domain-containing protein [Methylococcales bacterium]